MNGYYWLEKTIEKVLKLKSEDDYGKTQIIMSVIEAYEYLKNKNEKEME
jgi:hypothetical protein